MSQAVVAPSTGDNLCAPGTSSGNAGSFSPSRRGLLAGAMLLPALAAVPAMAAEGPEARSRRIDAKFWAALAVYQRECARFEAWPCATGEEEDARDADAGKAMHRAMQHLGGLAVHTLPALAAKMDVFRDFPDCDVRGGRFTAFEVAIMDVERMMVQELTA
ncbi:hypothetical protein PX699_00360 [Sphingobium sp. H39-3-25]|uniref:hypothetical protein n=1 Tax=Sphingobium arseniciresistens TaxID=3030834 RepID=UPI0023B90F5D|nr:hypothetical protein [Sphingobium arseniciresistens]